MRVLVFSDIHGNLPALETMLREEINIDKYINLGDVVNYGPWSNECVELVSELEDCINIRGNHEEYFINEYCDVKNQLVIDFYNQCIEGFKYRDIIKTYEETRVFNNYKLIHTLGVKDYIFHDTEVDLKENILLGHSHQQFVNKFNGYTILNPGSVGQNRKFINVSNYVVWDCENDEFELKSLKFDLSILITEMKSRNYPQECISYYENKNKAN